MAEITVEGYSDDIIYLEISEHMASTSRRLHRDEYGTENIFNINNHFNIVTSWDDKAGGFVIGISIIDEDINMEQHYDVRYDMDREHYSPKLIVTVHAGVPLVVKGIYGDRLSQLTNDLHAILDHDTEEVNRVLEVLKKNDIKI